MFRISFQKIFYKINWKRFDFILTWKNITNYHFNAQGYFANLICKNNKNEFVMVYTT